jgi:two-component system, response regulator YesN
LRRKNKVFVRLLTSYVVILLFPMIICGALYMKVESILIENANKNNKAILDQAAHSIDSRMVEIEQMVAQIAMHPKLLLLLDAKMSNEGKDLYSYVEFSKEMARYRAINSFIMDVYVYFNKQDIILTPSMKTDSNTFYRDMYKYERLSYNNYVEDVLLPYHPKTYLASQEIESGNKQFKMITQVTSLPMGQKNNVKGSLVVLFDEEKFRNLIYDIEGMQNGAIYIINKENEILMSTTENTKGITNIIGTGEVFASGNNNFLEVEQDDEEMMVTYITSELNGWTFISVVSKSIVLSQVEMVKRWSLLILLVCLFGGGTICYRMAYQNYRPVRDLVHALIRRDTSEQSHVNEYDLIREEVIALFNKEKNLEATLIKQLPVIRTEFLSRLLRGQVDVQSLSSDDFEFLDIDFPYSYFVVMIIDLDDCSRFMRKDNEEEWALIRFILSNVSSELLQDHAYSLELERNRVVLLINQQHAIGVQEQLYQMQEYTDQVIKVMDQRFKSKLTIATSNLHKGLGRVRECYSEAILAMEYKIIKGSGSSLHYEELRSSDHLLYNYPMEMESQLMNVVRNGDYDQAEKHLDQIYETNFLNGNQGMSPEMSRCLYNDILSTLYKLSHFLKSDSCTWFDSDREPAKELSECTTASEMHQKIKQYYKKMSLSFKNEYGGHKEQLIREIERYIEDHFHDNALSLTKMADHFDMNPSYLSTAYKNYSGQNVTEYIVSTRMKEAKQLLSHTTLNISDIAAKVGYASNIGLLRVFKKVEGITPGQYRANQGQIEKA